jgi:hypothetical protein
VLVDKSLEKKMDNIDDLAKLCKVKLSVMGSFKKSSDLKLDPRDTLTHPMHYIGQALSIHIYDEKDKLLCNDICLGSNLRITLCFLLSIY